MAPRIFRASTALSCAAALFFLAPEAQPDAATDGGATSSAFVPELQAAVTAAGSERALGPASVGIAIVDVDSGRWLAAVNEHIALNPASNAKLYTAGAALAILRGEHRYETTLSGKISGEAVSGSLGLRGFGDPSLKSADLWTMVQELKGYGVKRIDGDIVVDQEFYDELTTPPAFEQQPNEWAAFRAPVSAVALDENCITLTVRPSAVGAPAQLEVDPPGFVDLDGTVRTEHAGAADDVQLELAGSGLRMTAHVSGGIGADSRLVRYTRRAEDPRLLAGFALKALLEKADVKVAGNVKLGSSQGRVLAKHVSEPLSSLLYGLGKLSDNFYAEMIFKSLGGEAKHRPAKSAEAGEVVAEFLDRIGASDPGVVFKNGSGLFDADRVTAYSTASLLRWAWRDPQVEPEYLAQLAVGGVDGTLHKRFRNELTKRRVRAKTGTLDDAIALSGYVLREGRGPIAFSILYNRVAGKQDVARRRADKLVELIATLYK
jgi:D-alanyl-D-alanine carboxypeptidase/D-alanyl-D-alanine-endopeptidase (penicillin-binding protein 4)